MLMHESSKHHERSTDLQILLMCTSVSTGLARYCGGANYHVDSLLLFCCY